jgi:EpsI family protein
MQELVPALRNTLLSVGLIVIALLVYWPSSAALWHYWTNDNLGGAHGLIILPLAAWLLFLSRERLAAARVEPSALAGALLLLCSIAWLVFWRAGIQELHLLLLPLLMGLAVFAALGFEAACAVAFPLGYLYFAVPAWGIFASPLQTLTVHATGVLAPLIGVPVRMQGNLVLLPGVGAFEIERACSGANFLTVGLAVAALLGELERATLWRRTVLLASMGAVAVVANWIRVLAVVDAGYTTNMRHVLVTRGHYTFGWILFAIVMVGFVWLLARPYRRPPLSPAAAGRRETRVAAYAATVLVLVVMPLCTYLFVTRLDAGADPLVFRAPPGREGWQGPVAVDGGSWKPDFVGSHSQWDFTYRGPAGHNVEMVAVGYSLQTQGRELVSEENSLFGSAPLSAVAAGTVTLPRGSYIETVTADDRGRRSVVWSVYDIGGREFSIPLMSQLWYGVRSLGGPPYSVLFAFRTECAPSCDSARSRLRSFVETMGPDFVASVSRKAT